MSHDQTLHAAFVGHINTALNVLEAAGTLPAGLSRSAVAVEPPRDASHGDLATNAAMVLAKPAGTNPRALAEALVGELAKLPLVEAASIAGPGFINLTLSRTAWLTELAAIATLGADYGRSNLGGGTTVNVEYVSANPTGPMHMGHCRGAVVGDALATLLEFAGHKVIREYYVNDAGAQVQVLARSVHIRYREALGEAVGEIPEGLYPGEYLVPVGKALAEVVQEVGKDVVRFTMLTRKPEAQMDFDFAKVVEASKDNPVFYVQYAHARIRSTLRKGAAEGFAPSAADVGLLGEEELALVRHAAQFPRLVEAAAIAREPHRIAFFLGDLAGAFHAYWNVGNERPDKRFIVAQDAKLTGARLFLAAQIGQIVKNGLSLLGVEAVEEM